MLKHKTLASEKSGLPPGTAVYIGENSPEPTHISMHIYNKETYQYVDEFDIALLKTSLANGLSVWIDVHGLIDIDKISLLCHTLDIHPLVMEDIVNTRQRPKLEFFDDYLFIVFKLIDSPVAASTFNYEQISLLMKKNLLLTVRESDDYRLTSLYQRLEAKPSFVRENSVEYLLYSLMDQLIDTYFQSVEESTRMIENLEDLSINNPETINPKEIYLIKRRIIHLRKAIAPLRDIIHSLLKDSSDFISHHYFVYFRDLHDHTIRLIESINFHHELTSETLNIYMSILNTRMNQTMKILALFASVFIPLNFIVGIYGMNFEVMPILKWQQGFHGVLACMAVLVVLMLVYFKRKKLF